MLFLNAQNIKIPMSEIIQFPGSNKQKSDRDEAIDEALKGLPKKAREKIRFELIKAIDSYGSFFTQWTLSLPQDSSETLKKQIYDIAHQEHERKMRMLNDIMKLKVKVLVAEYYQRH
jgi:hypothetical protein